MAYLEMNGFLRSGLEVFSNFFEYDADGYAVDYQRPVIHLNNKRGKFLLAQPAFTATYRPNMIILGDQVLDPLMAEGLGGSTLSIGYLNEPDNAVLQEYLRVYDMVLLGDASLDPVIDLLYRIAEKSDATGM